MTDQGCNRCASCCRWPGILDITFEEVRAIAAELSMSIELVQKEYITSDPATGDLVVRSNPDLTCIFLAGTRCTVYPVRPVACREFPRDHVITPSLLAKCSLARRKVSSKAKPQEEGVEA